jgi:hypothetical protein
MRQRPDNPFDFYEKNSGINRQRVKLATQRIKRAVASLSFAKINAETCGKRIGKACVEYKDIGARDSASTQQISKYMLDQGIPKKLVEDVMTAANEILIFS